MKTNNMVQQFRKKPVVISAVQYDGSNEKEIIDFTGGAAKYKLAVGSSADGEGGKQSYESFTIPTLEGNMQIAEGDFVIKGVKGEFYPCKSDIFEQTYELAQ